LGRPLLFRGRRFFIYVDVVLWHTPAASHSNN
jgi:hypothetical protein